MSFAGGGFNNSPVGGGGFNSTGAFNNSNRQFTRKTHGRGGRGGNRGGGGGASTGGFNQPRYSQQHGSTGGFQHGGGFENGHTGSSTNFNRGRGRGRSGGKRSGGLVFADNILSFNMAADAHIKSGHHGILALASWEENNTIFTGGADGVVKMFNVNDATSVEQTEVCMIE